jgi:hypothetical protein
MQSTDTYYLLIDSASETIRSKLSILGIGKREKRLASGVDNWNTMVELAKSPSCIAVVAMLREDTYKRIADDWEAPIVGALLGTIAAKPHLVLVHEAVLGGAGIYRDEPPVLEEKSDTWGDWVNGEGEWSDAIARAHFGDISEDVRHAANQALFAAGIELTPYKRNAESSVLCSAFVDDQVQNLLFRVYVPSGSIFEREYDELIRLFHEWLTTVRGKRVRHEGYSTAHGRVIHFYSEDLQPTGALEQEFAGFSKFMGLIEHRSEAVAMLVGFGIEPANAAEIVTRYSIRARRLTLDIKHERERQILAIRQELESEVSEVADRVPSAAVAQLVDELMPGGPTLRAAGGTDLQMGDATGITINNQWVSHVEGAVIQHMIGSAQLSPDAAELERLIHLFADRDRADLLVAVREFVDDSAPQASRLKARQRLKGFLLKASDKIGQAAVNLLQKWLEGQMSL